MPPMLCRLKTVFQCGVTDDRVEHAATKRHWKESGYYGASSSRTPGSFILPCSVLGGKNSKLNRRLNCFGIRMLMSEVGLENRAQPKLAVITSAWRLSAYTSYFVDAFMLVLCSFPACTGLPPNTEVVACFFGSSGDHCHQSLDHRHEPLLHSRAW